MRRVNQKKLNEDVMAYCDIAWGLKELRERKDRPQIYRNIDVILAPRPETATLCRPISMSIKTDDFNMIKDKVVEPEKFSLKKWFIGLLRKVIGIK